MITERQLEVLYLIRLHVAHGSPPTLKELAKELGLISTKSVHGHLTALERKGYLVRTFRSARAITVGAQITTAKQVFPRMPFWVEANS